MNNRNGLIWGDVDLLLESDAFFGDVDEEETQPNKRMRRDESQMVESHSFRELSRKLDLLYASLPKHTLLLIPAQASLLPLRQMIAKKIRFKWEANSGTKKKPKVVLLGREKNNQRLQSEWDGNNDEIKLIDEAHRAAEGILFMRLKR